MNDTRRLLSLLRLSSPALPIGGFSYSQGLESAIELGWARDEAGVRDWIGSLLEAGIGRFEAPLCLALLRAIALDDWAQARTLSGRYLASRETAELRAETLQMGQSLLQMLIALPDCPPALVEVATPLRQSPDACPLPWAWGLATRAFALEPEDGLVAWLWAWAENQVMAAMKAVPLGQQAGQRLLSALEPTLTAVVARAGERGPQRWSNFAPGLAIASSQHETQYSRLFRS
jgi:urease accessory protein